jgi:hypothetical protein
MTLTQHILKLLSMIVHCVSAAGVLLLIAAAAFGVIAAYRAQWIKLPKQPEVIIAPVRVSIVGPDKGTIGTPYIFSAEITGDGGLPTWSTSGGLIHERDGGRTVVFTTTDEGEYVLTVVVGGEGRQAAVDSVSFTAMNVTSEEDITAQETIAQARKIVEQQSTLPPKPPTIAELVGVALGGGNDMAYSGQAEAQLRMLASRVKFSGADFANDGALSIIAKYPGWSGFPDDVRSIVNHEAAQGRAKTPAGIADVLLEIAATLKRSK